MARPVSRAELARRAGVSGAAITKACKVQLAAACIGGRVDLDHPAVRKYLAGKDGAPTPTRAEPRSSSSKTSAPRRKQNEPSAPGKGVRVVSQVVEDVGSVADMTIREVIQRFGTVTAFKDWLTSLKAIEDIRERRLRNEEADGRLIPREPVKHHVFGAIDAANRRLLNDSPKTIARRVYALAKTGAAIEEAEQIVREIISSQLRPVKVQAARVLRNV